MKREVDTCRSSQRGKWKTRGGCHRCQRERSGTGGYPDEKDVGHKYFLELIIMSFLGQWDLVIMGAVISASRVCQMQILTWYLWLAFEQISFHFNNYFLNASFVWSTTALKTKKHGTLAPRILFLYLSELFQWRRGPYVSWTVLRLPEDRSTDAATYLLRPCGMLGTGPTTQDANTYVYCVNWFSNLLEFSFWWVI